MTPLEEALNAEARYNNSGAWSKLCDQLRQDSLKWRIVALRALIREQRALEIAQEFQQMQAVLRALDALPMNHDQAH